MELEVTLGAGLSYRFAPNWSIGAETQYQTEFETEVGRNAGPGLPARRCTTAAKNGGPP